MTDPILTKAESAWHVKAAKVMTGLFCMALFTSVALTNIAVMGLLLLAPFAWYDLYKTQQTTDSGTRFFFALVITLCAWDVTSNLLAGYSMGLSLKALVHDMRTLGFVVLLWAIFANRCTARFALWAIGISVTTLAGVNLFLTLIGILQRGEYFTTQIHGMSHMSHMYGQAIVGLFFVLGQIWIVRPSLSWRIAVPMTILVMSLFLASERRSGYLMLAAGFVVWGALNVTRLREGQNKLLMLLTLVGTLVVAVSSDIVQKRMAIGLLEFNEYFSMSPEQRAGVVGAVSTRLQFAATMIELVKQNNWFVGVGSLGFEAAFRIAAAHMGITPEASITYNWGNPHNEYLYMLATKGVVGLALYLAIFTQACRVAWVKTDEVQRIGLVMFVFLFMLSITTNSMMVDMEEGHFMMLILLLFLAPKSLRLTNTHNKKDLILKN